MNVRLVRTCGIEEFFHRLINLLSYLTAGFYVLRRGYHAEAFVEVDGREDHALALDAHHLAWSEIGHEEDALADEFLGVLVELSNA